MALGWSLSNSGLLAARTGHDAFTFNRRLFVIGGTPDGSAASLNVESAVVDQGGSLETFSVTSTLPAALNAGRINFGLAQHANKLYLVGGADPTGASSAYADVAIGTISPDGSINWAVGPSLPSALAGLKCAILNGWLYAIGGNPSVAAPTAALANHTGTLGLAATGNAVVLTAATDTFVTPLPAAGSLIVIPATAALAVSHASNAGIYMVTGTPSSTVIHATKVRDIAASGVTAPVSTSAETPVANNDVQYSAATPQANSVLAAQIQSDGSLGAWQSASGVAMALSGFNITGHQLVAGLKDLYLIGGLTDGISASQLVWRGRPDATGVNIAWTQEQAGLSTARSFAAAAAVGDKKLAVVGGSSTAVASGALATIDELVRNSDGTLTTTLTASAMTKALFQPAVAKLGGWLFAIGGENASGTLQSAIYQAALQSNSTL